MKIFMTIFHWLISALRMVTIIIGAVVGTLILIPLCMTLLGYRVDANPWALGEKAAKEKDVSLCATIINYGLFGPPSSEARRSCIHAYAEHSKDPSVCRMLMPSEYGMSCTGYASTVNSPCSLESDRGVRGNGIEVSLRECVYGKNQIVQNSCCVISRVAWIKDQNDCSTLKDQPEFYDQCLDALAFKKRDPSYCRSINHPNLREVCEIDKEAMQKDPTLCKDCFKTVDSVEPTPSLPQEPL